MNYPTLESIFWESDIVEKTTPEIKELNRLINEYLHGLAVTKALSEDETNHIKEQCSELEVEAKSAGFIQGFRFAVRLFMGI